MENTDQINFINTVHVILSTQYLQWELCTVGACSTLLNDCALCSVATEHSCSDKYNKKAMLHFETLL